MSRVGFEPATAGDVSHNFPSFFNYIDRGSSDLWTTTVQTFIYLLQFLDFKRAKIEKLNRLCSAGTVFYIVADKSSYSFTMGYY